MKERKGNEWEEGKRRQGKRGKWWDQESCGGGGDLITLARKFHPLFGLWRIRVFVFWGRKIEGSWGILV